MNIGHVKNALALVSVAMFLFLAGCDGGAKDWSLEPAGTVEGFKTPECARVNPADGTVYVSNIFKITRDAKDPLDANGFISKLAPGGKLVDRAAIKGTAKFPVHSPSGMCILDGYLYFNDVNAMKRRPLDGSGPTQLVPVPGAKGLNDAATDGKYVYTTSTGQGVIYRFDPATGKSAKLMDLPRVNGITFWKGRMFGVTIDKEKSDVYELDPTGKGAPKAFGLAGTFVGMDSIEVLPDGTVLLTDCLGHKIYTVSPDRKTAKVVASEGLEYPADIGVDLERGYVYVPQFYRGTVEVFRLKSTNK
jgi:DNA-binding beta-propeller fold protein YncE